MPFVFRHMNKLGFHVVRVMAGWSSVCWWWMCAFWTAGPSGALGTSDQWLLSQEAASHHRHNCMSNHCEGMRMLSPKNTRIEVFPHSLSSCPHMLVHAFMHTSQPSFRTNINTNVLMEHHHSLFCPIYPSKTKQHGGSSAPGYNCILYLLVKCLRVSKTMYVFQSVFLHRKTAGKQRVSHCKDFKAYWGNVDIKYN